jgi:hypothetical protein
MQSQTTHPLRLAQFTARSQFASESQSSHHHQKVSLLVGQVRPNDVDTAVKHHTTHTFAAKQGGPPPEHTSYVKPLCVVQVYSFQLSIHKPWFQTQQPHHTRFNITTTSIHHHQHTIIRVVPSEANAHSITSQQTDENNKCHPCSAKPCTIFAQHNSPIRHVRHNTNHLKKSNFT